MIYQVRHLTTYLYEKPVTFARCALRLTPWRGPDQAVLDSRLVERPYGRRFLESLPPARLVHDLAQVAGHLD